jgi:hypothetical protein
MKRLLMGSAALVVLSVLGFGALAWRPAIAPINPPAPGSFAPDLMPKAIPWPAAAFARIATPPKADRNSLAAVQCGPHSV